MAVKHLIHTLGDVVMVMAENGSVRAYIVQRDGSLEERTPVDLLAYAVRTGRAEGDHI
jgi:hypothetical protein